MKWAIFFAVGIALNLWLYQGASPAVKNDMQVLAIVGGLVVSVVGLQSLSFWVMNRDSGFALTLVGCLMGLLALVWSLFVLYVFIRILYNSVT
jgi:hypothetical protein